MARIRVLELDQWTSTGNVTDFTIDEFDDGDALAQIHGGDSREIKKLGIESASFKWVEEGWCPPKGYVWYVAGPDGKPVFFKANYDSSG